MGNFKDRWQLSERLFNEDDIYSFLEKIANENGFIQTQASLPLMKKCHEGQYRKGEEKIPYIYHPLIVANHALSLGFNEDEVIATALLHDVLEDCDVSKEELPVNDKVKEALELLTFSKNENETKEEAKKRYYDALAKNRIASIVKVLDRCNNISGMAAGFKPEKIAQYIDETQDYVYPVLDVIKNNYPEYTNAVFILTYHMKAVLESLKRMLQFI